MRDVTAVRCWLGIGAVAVVAQQSLTVYSTSGAGPHLLWGGISLFLLYRVYRGGRAARVLFLALALVGAAVYAWQFGSDVRISLLTLAYGVQAAVMLVPAVRSWTRPQETRSAGLVGAG